MDIIHTINKFAGRIQF